MWKSLCRNQDLEEALPQVFERVAPRLKMEHLWIRRVDLERSAIETVADAGSDGGVAPTRTELSTEAARALSGWCRAGEIRVGSLGDEILRTLAPAGVSGRLSAAPIHDAKSDVSGALLIRHAELPGELQRLLSELVEPLAIGLVNHDRQRELMRLREALEADKRALLSRLDRQDIADTVVGASAGLSNVMRSVAQVAPTDAPVLILGETGSGKEVVARAIHHQSRRSRGPMVRVNCGAISPGLIDSELFGHERGSFTGAVGTRKGWFERADGGTLFLDEVAELPLDAQVRLLRVLQEGVVERVGGHRPIHVDVRIIAATHRDLEQMVGERRFRQDLWYRLGVFIIPLPALRERRSDIPELAAHFAARAGRRLGAGPISPSRAEVELLLAYDWPGNVRELAAVIERAAILGDGKRLDLARALAGSPMSASASSGSRSRHEIISLDEAMKRHVEEALDFTRGRIEGRGGAASLLGINPHTLRARMRKLGIDWSRFRLEYRLARRDGSE